MFISIIGMDPSLFVIAALLDLILLIAVLVVFFGMGRNLKRIRQLHEKINKMKFTNYAYLTKVENEWSKEKEEVLIYGEDWIADKDIIGSTDDGTPLIKEPKD